MKKDLKPFMKGVADASPEPNTDTLRQLNEQAKRQQSTFERLKPKALEVAQRTAELHAQPGELSRFVDQLTSLEAEREQRLAEASGRYLAKQFEPKLKKLEQRLDKAEDSAERAFRRSIIAGTISGFLATILYSAVSYLFKKYVMTPTQNPTVMPKSNPSLSHGERNITAPK